MAKIQDSINTNYKFGLYFTTNEIAELIGIHSVTVRKWVEQGMPYKLGGPGSKFKFDLKDVLEWTKVHKPRHYRDYIRSRSQN